MRIVSLFFVCMLHTLHQMRPRRLQTPAQGNRHWSPLSPFIGSSSIFRNSAKGLAIESWGKTTNIWSPEPHLLVRRQNSQAPDLGGITLVYSCILKMSVFPHGAPKTPSARKFLISVSGPLPGAFPRGPPQTRANPSVKGWATTAIWLRRREVPIIPWGESPPSSQLTTTNNFAKKRPKQMKGCPQNKQHWSSLFHQSCISDPFFGHEVAG